jgi:SAM-dependent methyltransferase
MSIPAEAAARTGAPDLAAIKARQQTAWSSGDYALIGVTVQIVGESLAEACDLRCDERVLDVAAGNGNATLAAARRGCRVTSTDYVAALLERGAERANAERLPVDFQAADAEDLPFDDASFDVVLSTFGVMFTPDHARSASEMTRVCRPGGRIGLANWTPGGFIGQLFKVLGRHVPPPAGVQAPSLWGTEAHLQELFGARASGIAVERRMFNSATARPRTSSTCSAPGTGRCTRPSRRSARTRPPRSSATSRSSWSRRTARAPGRSWCPRSMSRWW